MCDTAQPRAVARELVNSGEAKTGAGLSLEIFLRLAIAPSQFWAVCAW